MSNKKETAGKTAERRAASAAKLDEAHKAITQQKRLRRITAEGSIIYRPAQYPFEMVYAKDVFVIQTECFVDESLYNDDKPFIQTKMVTSEKHGAGIFCSARIFDSRNDAMDYIIKNLAFYFGEDGNMYPRVLKVRASMIVEGVAFEPVMRDIKGGAKLEGVA